MIELVADGRLAIQQMDEFLRLPRITHTTRERLKRSPLAGACAVLGGPLSSVYCSTDRTHRQLKGKVHIAARPVPCASLRIVLAAGVRR